MEENDSIFKFVSDEITQIPDTQTLRRELELYERLNSSKDLTEFTRRITETLSKINITNWGYSRLDVPAELGIEGLIGSDYVDYTRPYQHEAFYECDMALQHILKSDNPIFQSSFRQFIDNSALDGEFLLRNRELFKMTESFGFFDYFSLPISSIDGGRAVFCICCKGENSDSFRKKIVSIQNEITMIAKLIDQIGISKFSTYVLGTKKTHDKIKCSRGIRLIEIMHKEKLSQKAAAARMHISSRTAERHAAKIRDYLGAANIGDAIIIASRRGYF